MKKTIIVFILFISIIKVESKETEIRWDYKIASKANELIPFKMYWKSNSWFWTHKSNEKIVDLKNNLKICSEEYIDDNLLCLGFLYLRQNKKLSVEIASKVLKRNIDEETILYPFSLLGNTNWSGEDRASKYSATILDPIWTINFSDLIKIHYENKLKRATTFPQISSSSRSNVLRYFEHLKKYPRKTKDFALYLKYISAIINKKEYSVLLKSFIEKNNERFIKICKIDREAANEVFGYHIYAIPRIIQSFYRDLHHCYSLSNETDKLINSLEKFITNYSTDGWYKEFNKELAKAYIKRNNIGDKEKALEQYQIIGKATYNHYKNMHKSYLLYEYNKKSFNEYVIRDWVKEIEEINKKIKALGGEPIDFEKQLTKLKKWYKEKEKTIAQEIKEDSFYQSLQRPLNEEELKIKQQIESFIPEDREMPILKKDISENNIQKLFKWTESFKKKYAKPAIEKLAESEEGRKILRDALPNATHWEMIFDSLKKNGESDLLGIAQKIDDIDFKEFYIIYYLGSLPRIEAHEYYLNKLKEYKNDDGNGIAFLLLSVSLCYTGKHFTYLDIPSIEKLIENEKESEKKLFYLKKYINLCNIPNEYLVFLNKILQNKTLMNDKDKSEYILDAIEKITFYSQKKLNLEEGKIIIKDLLNRENSKFFKNYNKIIKNIEPILKKEEDLIDKANSIKRKAIEDIDLLKKILNTTNNDGIKKDCFQGLYKWILNYKDKLGRSYLFFTRCLSKENNIEIRKVAIFALAMNKDKSYIKNLEPLTKDENEEIKIMATDAIEYIKQGASE